MKISEKSILDELLESVEEFYDKPPGELIENPSKKIYLSREVAISRRSLKHFVESRLKQNLPLAELIFLLAKAIEIADRPEIVLPNANKNYPDSQIWGKFFEKKSKAVILVMSGRKEVISLHFKHKKDFLKLCRRNKE